MFFLIISNPIPSVARQEGGRLGFGGDYESILGRIVEFSIQNPAPDSLTQQTRR